MNCFRRPVACFALRPNPCPDLPLYFNLHTWSIGVTFLYRYYEPSGAISYQTTTFRSQFIGLSVLYSL